jgi:hypothetical protein
MKRALEGLAILLATLLVLALAGEVAVRAFTEIVPPLRVKHPRIGEHYRPGFEGAVFIPESGRKVRLRFNSLGFRGPDRPLAKPPGARRIAVLGDSMIASLAVEEEQTLVQRLERALSSSASWEVMNFGVSAASPGQALLLYRELAHRFEPEIVIASFFNGNDLSDSSYELDHYRRPYFELDGAGRLVLRPMSVSRAKLSEVLNEHSRLYVWQKDLVNRALHTAERQTRGLLATERIWAVDEAPEVQRAWAIVEAVLVELKREVTSRGSRLLVVQLPSGRQVYPDRFQPMLDAADGARLDPLHPERRLAEICARNQLGCRSLAQAFRARAGGGSSTEVPPEELLYFGGSGHFTEAGNALAADEIARWLSGS